MVSNPPVTFEMTRGGKTFSVTRDIDPEYMRKIGKKGFAVTSEKINKMIADPNADPDKVLNMLRWLHQRIRMTTTTYRTLYSRIRSAKVKQGYKMPEAHGYASGEVKRIWQERKGNPVLSVLVKDSSKYKVGDTVRIRGIRKSYKIVGIG